MKNKHACTIAALLLAAVLTVTAINSLYVKNTAEHILSSLQALPKSMEESSYSIKELSEYWEERKTMLNMGLSKPLLDKVSLAFDELLISAKEGDSEEYKKSMARLIRAIEDMKDLEEFSTENIF